MISEYKIHNWDIPKDYLCAPIPGRANYIHYVADLLASSNNGIIPEEKTVQGLDIGIGSNCIYPIIGNSVYNWSFGELTSMKMRFKIAKNSKSNNYFNYDINYL